MGSFNSKGADINHQPLGFVLHHSTTVLMAQALTND